MAQTTLKHLLGKITQLWTAQIKLCEQRKSKDFGETAVEIMRYVGQRVNPRRMGMLVDGLPMTPDMQNEYLSTLNWAQLFVDVMAPYVSAAVPNRLVTAVGRQLPPEISTTRPDIVQQQQMLDAKDRMTCFELQEVLNWSPRAYDAKKESRMAVSEGLAKGRGVCWLELDDAPHPLQGWNALPDAGPPQRLGRPPGDRRRLHPLPRRGLHLPPPPAAGLRDRETLRRRRSQAPRGGQAGRDEPARRGHRQRLSPGQLDVLRARRHLERRPDLLRVLVADWPGRKTRRRRKIYATSRASPPRWNRSAATCISPSCRASTARWGSTPRS